MNAKIYSLLLMLFLGLSMGFTSCSDDDDNSSSDDNNSSSYESGETAGKEFIQAYDAYNAAENTVDKATSGAKLLSCYSEYKSHKEDSEWKKGFLVGAAKEDANKYETLSALLDSNLDFSSVTGIANAMTELQKILGK